MIALHHCLWEQGVGMALGTWAHVQTESSNPPLIADRIKQPFSIRARSNLTLLTQVYVTVGLQFKRAYLKKKFTQSMWNSYIHSGSGESFIHWLGTIWNGSLIGVAPKGSMYTKPTGSLGWCFFQKVSSHGMGSASLLAVHSYLTPQSCSSSCPLLCWNPYGFWAVFSCRNPLKITLGWFCFPGHTFSL